MQMVQAICCLIIWQIVYVQSERGAKKKTVPLEVSNESNEGLDELVTNYRRSGADEVWPWDIWCQLQPVLGTKRPNDTVFTRYFYDRQIDECRPYNHTGKLRNKNYFVRKENCERYCKKAAYALINHMSVKSKLTCALQYDAGVCFTVAGVKPSILWYYDINEKNCKNFTHSGCGGNHNRWKSHYSCWDFCGKAKIPYLRVGSSKNRQVNSNRKQKVRSQRKSRGDGGELPGKRRKHSGTRADDKKLRLEKKKERNETRKSPAQDDEALFYDLDSADGEELTFKMN